MSAGAAAPRSGSLRDGPAPAAPGMEAFATIAEARGARIERIASRAVRDGDWYDQGWDEFVLLIEGRARLAFADGTERNLAPGDWCLLPAGCRHRVAETDPGAVTLWLAVHLPSDV